MPTHRSSSCASSHLMYHACPHALNPTPAGASRPGRTLSSRSNSPAWCQEARWERMRLSTVGRYEATASPDRAAPIWRLCRAQARVGYAKHPALSGRPLGMPGRVPSAVCRDAHHLLMAVLLEGHLDDARPFPAAPSELEEGWGEVLGDCLVGALSNNITSCKVCQHHNRHAVHVRFEDWAILLHPAALLRVDDA